MFFDIDHFKKFNVLFGHDAGDALLVAVGSLLKRWVRPSEIVARYGGEEFIVVLPDTSLQRAVERAEDLRIQVEQLSVTHHNQRLGSVTISAGISVFPADGANQMDLIKAADKALYQAKDTDRNRIVTALIPRTGQQAQVNSLTGLVMTSG